MIKKRKAQKQRMYNDVEFLTTLTPSRSCNNPESLEKVCDYIKNEYRKIDIEYLEQKWEVNGEIYSNIIASYNPGKNKKRLIVGAHYDVCGPQPGADDNASGVAGLLETVRLFVENKPKIDYQVDFVAYCLEEPPFFASDKMGSYVNARSLNKNNVDVIGMICYDMIGYFSDKPNSQPYPTNELAKLYPSKANFIILVGIKEYGSFNVKFYENMCFKSKIDVQMINFPDGRDLAGLSDHSNYWKFGYNAIMINDTAFIRNPNYHMETDTIETLDFDKMSEVVNSAYRAMIKF